MITPLFASILALMFLSLSFRALLLRRKYRIAVGDSGNLELLRAVRAHGNFAEYVPIALLLIYFIEQSQAQAWLVYCLGTALVLGRLSHAFGLSQVKEPLFFRVFGMVCTLNTIGVSALYLLVSRFI